MRRQYNRKPVKANKGATETIAPTSASGRNAKPRPRSKPPPHVVTLLVKVSSGEEKAVRIKVSNNPTAIETIETVVKVILRKKTNCITIRNIVMMTNKTPDKKERW